MSIWTRIALAVAEVLVIDFFLTVRRVYAEARDDALEELKRGRKD